MTDVQGQSGTDGNPAWDDFLQYVPEDKREAVTPLLQQWDRGVQDKLAQVRSEYEPWKPIVESGYDAETTKFAQEVLAVMQSDPRKLFDALGEHYQWFEAGEEEEETGKGRSGETQEKEYLDPRYEDLDNRYKVLEQILLAQRTNELQAQEEAELDKALTKLQADHKDFYNDDIEEDVVRRMYVNPELTPEEAYQDHLKYVDKVKSFRRQPPRIMGGGSGGIPTPEMDPKKMSDKEVRDMIAQTIQQRIMEG